MKLRARGSVLDSPLHMSLWSLESGTEDHSFLTALGPIRKGGWSDHELDFIIKGCNTAWEEKRGLMQWHQSKEVQQMVSGLTTIMDIFFVPKSLALTVSYAGYIPCMHLPICLFFR